MKRSLLFEFSFLALLACLVSCKHEVPQPMLVEDTTGNGPGSGIPCDSNTVYFEQQILPILISNCSQPGCHNAASAQDGVVLTNYSSIISTGQIVPGNPGASELFEVITESDPDKIMPPLGETPLTPAQINLIQTWIQQGAQNNFCDQNLGPCDTLNVTFSGSVVPILQSKCNGCHSGNAPAGSINLSTHAGVISQVTSGKLIASINHSPSASPMPKSSPKLPDCEIRKIEIWVNQGAPNN